MDSENPYSAPQAELLTEAVAAGEGAVPSAIVGDLLGARRWMAVFAGAGCVITVLVLVASPVLLGLGGGAIPIALFSLLYMGAAARLMGTAAAIGRLSREPTATKLAAVTGGLSVFWRLAGGVTAIAVALAIFGSVIVNIFLRAA